MRWNTKAAIGAAGGLALVLVRLVEANFYIGQGRLVLLGGLATGFAFVVTSAIATSFAEEHTPGKLFRYSLLVPSLLIGILHQGTPPPPTTSPTDIPTIGMSFFEGDAHAQAAAGNPRDVQILTRSSLTNDLADGARLLVGRPPENSTWAYVVGKSVDRSKALEARERLEQLPPVVRHGGVELMRPEGSKYIYLIIGPLRTASEVSSTQRAVSREVVDFVLNGGSDESQKKAARWVVQGRAVSAVDLFTP